ncbi:MAG: M28 family peptidase, partial [Armatimonadetes bacterium]|nr:M28 family peptidase [Armatimonadota bacterium]
MTQPTVAAKRLEAHLTHLCRDIGTRLAGTPAEAAGAEYLAGEFRKLGLETAIQEFPCIAWSCQKAQFKVQQGGRWRESPVQPNTQSPSTDGELEAELVYLETAQPEDTEGRDLRGKVGLLFGSAYASVERMERLCNSGLAALLYVDDRFPFDWNVASGLIAGWIDLLTIPTATIPYMSAWDLVRRGVRRVRLDLQVQTFQSHSQNVVATLPGKRRLPPLVLGGHHDSVALGVGAEDDGSGVVAVLELARVCREIEPLRPIKFVTFGWEENLSEGARHYAIHPDNDAATTALMLNFDSLGSWLGNNHAYCVGERGLRDFVVRHLQERRYVAEVVADVSPFSDQFPFNLLGVPSVWFHRSNFPGSRFYH